MRVINLKTFFNLLFVLFYLVFASLVFAKNENANNNNDVQSTKKSISPIIGYNPTDKLIVGGAYFINSSNPDIPGYFMGTQFMFNSKYDYALGLNYRKWTTSPYIYDFSTSLSNFRKEYYGEGNNTKTEDVTEIKSLSSSSIFGVDYKWNKLLAYGTFLDLRIQKESALGSKITKEITENKTDLALGLSTKYDLRDNSFSTENGYFAKMDFRFIPEQFMSPKEVKDFMQAEIDLRYFNKFFSKNIIALKASGGYSFGDPSYLFRYSLGGGNQLRGYYSNRFRGKKYYLTQAEYRFPLMKNINFVLFTDAGDIADKDFGSIKTTYGYGFRFGLPPDHLMKLRFDLAFAKDQASLYVIFGEVF